MIKEVSTAKFDAIMGKSIHLGYCPKCRNLGGKIQVLMPCYGKTGAKVSCNHCDYETRLYPIHTMMFEMGGPRSGTPTIEKSLMAGIRNAINGWNKSALGGGK